jgi:hypothetical protein
MFPWKLTVEGVESHCEKQKVTHTGLGGKENQAPWRNLEVL